MNETQVATIATVGIAVVGMLICLVIGYTTGYKDAKRHMEKDKK